MDASSNDNKDFENASDSSDIIYEEIPKFNPFIPTLQSKNNLVKQPVSKVEWEKDLYKKVTNFK